jgi:hypothetical protein
VTYEGKTKTVGFFHDEEQAARARDRFIQEKDLKGRRMNFGADGKENPKPGRTSRYTGVSWCKATKKWMVQIRHNKKQHTVTRCNNEDEAARAYDRYVKDHKLENRKVNFP